MGPKKKGVKKKVGKKSGGTKGPTIIDGVPVSEMTKDQLEGHVRRLQDEVRSRQGRGITSSPISSASFSSIARGTSATTTSWKGIA